MSFIRQGQESQYVNLGDGSIAYLYDTGNRVQGFNSYSEFINALCVHAGLAGFPDERVEEFERALEDHYVERRGDNSGVGPKPEMAHIVAQHLDSRLDSMELTDEDLELLQAYASSEFKECPGCREEWRPVYKDEERDLCPDCYADYIHGVEVTADVSDLIDYVKEELPRTEPPTSDHDEEFYYKAVSVYMDREGEEREALAAQLGQACDEIMDAEMEERTVDKRMMLDILESIDG